MPKKLTGLLLLLFFGTSLLAQQVVSGKISTADSSVAGVSIQVKGGRQATQSDKEGNFQITVSPNAVLLISHVGFVTQELNVGNQKTLNVQLQSLGQNLQDVVVVGYGTQKKANLTGSS